METKVYINYIEEYKKKQKINYFYAKDNLLNKLYGFEDRGEFTIEVLDEMLELKQKIDKAKEYINNCPEYLWANVNTKTLLEILGDEE